MNGWALLWILAQRYEPSSEETALSLLMTSVMEPVSSVSKDLIARVGRVVSGALGTKVDRLRRFVHALQTQRLWWFHPPLREMKPCSRRSFLLPMSWRRATTRH